jgi:hypothetical protein
VNAADDIAETLEAASGDMSGLLGAEYGSSEFMSGSMGAKNGSSEFMTGRNLKWQFYVCGQRLW